MKVKRLIDAQVVATFPAVKRIYWDWYKKCNLSLDEIEKRYAEDLREAAKEFHAFLRDHRSQDIISVDVEEICEDVCSFCGVKWEDAVDEDGIPACCAKAVDEHHKAIIDAAIPDGKGR